MVNHRSENLLSSYEVNSAIDDFAVSVQSGSKSTRGYLLEKNQQSPENYQKTRKNSRDFLAKLIALARSQQELQSLTKLEELLNKLLAFQDILIEKVDEGKVKEAIETWSKGNARALVQDVVDMIEEMQQREDQIFATTAKQQQEALNALKFTVMLASGLSLKISTLVRDIQSAISMTVVVTHEGTKTVEEGTRVAQETSESFAGVEGAVNNIVINSQQISLNINQQPIAIQQIVSAMNDLNIAARETASGISQIRFGTQQLNESAQAFKAII
ncbi:CHASE3 domain-containing protein [Nostoc sp. LEGE 12447]|uniref:CHASE3 domain-containing protein n=1 Tax=Nostoc sp. LEGE 12447 TaxID=1828640 RepID=UPI001883CDD0|nr:CHASE3 domain-containing protein [Nostoc sp. LEGE 12447]MBE9002953.1 CHASE3 domain-containing protein [Nostoc sp. LEGE 12447]